MRFLGVRLHTTTASFWVDFLKKEIRKASTQPRTAYLATKCLEPLLIHPCDDVEIYYALEEAVSVEKTRHIALAEQAQRCLQHWEPSYGQ